MIRRTRPGVSSIGAALVVLLVLLAPACVTLRQKTRRTAATPTVLSPNEPLSSPQVTDRLPPSQPVPAEAVPPDTVPLLEPPVVAITPAPPVSEPAPQPRPAVRRPRPAAAATAPQPEIPAPEPAHTDTVAGPPPQLRPMLTPAQEKQLQLSINRSLNAAEQGLKRAAIPASDRERLASAARVRAFIEQAQQAVQQGDLNRARSLAERAELLASDLARSPK